MYQKFAHPRLATGRNHPNPREASTGPTARDTLVMLSYQVRFPTILIRIATICT